MNKTDIVVYEQVVNASYSSSASQSAIMIP